MIEGLQIIDLAEIARSEGVELRRSGSRYVGLCPIHREKTPSFFVFSNNKWKCWGCGASGDSIDLIRQIHRLSFKDALAHLGINQGSMTIDVKKQIEDRKQRAYLIKRFRKWETRKADQAATMIRCINKVSSAWETIADFEREGDILKMVSVYEHQLEILCSRNDRLKFELLTGRKTPDPFDLGQSIEKWVNKQ